MLRFVITTFVVVWAGVAQAAIDIKTVTSPGGIDAWVVEEPAIPFVALEIRVRGGASLDEPGEARRHQSDDRAAGRRGGVNGCAGVSGTS